jgi:hypothetical protein
MVNRDHPQRACLGAFSLQCLKAWREELAVNVTSSRAREVEDLHERLEASRRTPFRQQTADRVDFDMSFKLQPIA